MKKFLFILITACFACIQTGISQVTVTVENENGCPGDTVFVDFTWTNFSNMASFEFGVTWNPAIIQLLPPAIHSLPPSAIFNPNVAAGELRVVWIDFNPTPPPPALTPTIFTLKFKLLGSYGSSSPVQIVDLPPTFVSFFNANGQVPHTIVNGAVTISDTQDPIIVCTLQDTTIVAAQGQSSVMYSWTPPPTPTDNCVLASFTSNFSPGASFPIGSTNVGYTATDAAGNDATCDFTVTIQPPFDPAALRFVLEDATLCDTDQLIVRIRAFNFDSISSMQFGIEWDEAALQFNGIVIDTPDVLWNYSLANVSNGELYFTWFDLFPVSLPDSSSLISLYFTVDANAIGDSTLIEFAQFLPAQPIAIFDGDGNLIPLNEIILESGTIMFDAPPLITCPMAVSATTNSTCTATGVPLGIATATDDCAPPAPTITNNALLAFPKGSTTVTWTATDAANQTSTCTQMVTVTDDDAPAITCPANLSVNTDAGLCTAVVTYTTPVGTDNCPMAATAQNVGSASGAAFPKGVTTNTFTVTDMANLTATCSFTVTVADNQAPAITCPVNISVNTDAGLCTAVVTYTTPVGTDNCPMAATAQNVGLASGAAFPKGVTTNTFTVTDMANLTATCSFTVTVADNQAPAITCPANIAVNTDAGLCSAVVNYTTPVGTDNCPMAMTAQTVGLASGAAFPKGVTTNTFTVTDMGNLTATCSFTVTVTDNQPPAITCPANISVNTDPGLCTAVVTYTTPVGTDNCPMAATVQTVGLASGVAFPKGVTTNTFTVTDMASLTASCSFTVTVTDAQAPAITCPANIAVNTDVGLCSAVVTYTAPVGTDNCPMATTAQTVGLASGATFPKGVTTNTFTVTDMANLTATCSFTVTVTDNQPPVITCPANIAVNTDAGLCTAVVTYTTPVGTDNCPMAATAQTVGLASGAAFPKGVTTNTFTVTDMANLTATCSFTVTVSDNAAPVPNVANLPNATGECSASVTAPTANDNCAGTITGTTTDPTSYSTQGTFTVNWTYNDGNGNTSTQTQMVVVDDVTAPVPAASPLADAVGECSVTVTAPTAIDLCAGMIVGTTTDPTSYSTQGTFTITWTYNDDNGNSATQTQTVIVDDNTPPTIAGCPANITQPADVGECDATITWTAPTVSDNCPGAVLSAPTTASGSTFNVGPATTVSYTATDAAGNTATCSFTVTVTDNQAPVLSGCPGNIAMNVDVNACDAVVNWTAPTATDNCAGGTFMATHTPGDTFDAGPATTVTYTATDASNNVTVCSFTVTVTDNMPPTIGACPADISLSTEAGLCNAVATWTDPTFDDNCSATLSMDATSGDPFPTGTTTVTYTVEDGAGNTVSCDFDVTVTDNEDPTIDCPAGLLIEVPAGTLSVAVNNIGLDASGDNCGAPAVTWILSVATTNNGIGNASGTPFNVGITTVTYTVTDAEGNTASCSFEVNVEEEDVLTIICPSNISVDNDAGQCSAVVNGLAPIANPPGDVQEIFYQITGATPDFGPDDASGPFNVGISTVTYTAVSNVDNSTATCTFTVEVTDDEDPIFTTCQGGAVVNTPGQCGWAFDGAIFGASDNCPNPTLLFSHTPGMLLPPGDHTVFAQATDAAGNTALCSILIVVIDTEGPVISNCPLNIATVADPGACAAIVNWTSPTATDNCTLLAFTPSQGPGTPFNVGVTPVEYVAVDDVGNVAKCQFSVTVQDTQVPQFLFCPANIVKENDDNQCGAVVIWSQPLVSDNCAVVSFVSNFSSGNSFDVGTTQVIYTATDAAGNSKVCTFNVTVNDTEYPFIADVPADLTLISAPGECGVTVIWDAPSASDNCGLEDFGSTVSSGVFVEAGQALVVEYIAIDVNANVTVEEFSITVLDNTPPVFVCPQNVTVVADGSFIDDPSGIVISLQAVDCESVTLNYTEPAVSDACGLDDVQQTAGPHPGELFTAGTHILTYVATDKNGNLSTCSFSVTVEAVAAAEVVAFPPQPCEGEDVFFFATEYTGVTYEWKAPNGTVVSTESFFNLTGITAAQAGVYTLEINGNSCQQVGSVEVIVHTNPIVTASANNLLCLGGNADLNLEATAQSSSFITDWIWQFPDNSYVFEQNPSVDNADEDDSGQYIVAAISSFGCVGFDTLDVLISNTPQMPTLFGTDAVSCAGEPIVLNGQVFTGNNVSYHWSATPASGSGLTSINNHVLEVNPTAAGTYTYNFYAEVDGCTSATAEWVVNVETAPALVLSVIGETACVDGSTSVVLNAALTSSPVTSWLWTGVNTGFSSNEQSPVLPNVTIADSDIYALTATTANGCVTTTSLPVNFTTNPPAPQLFVSTSEICLGLPVTLTAFPAFPAGTTFDWQGENLPPDAEFKSSIEVTPTSTGTLTYSVAANINGCWTSPTLIQIIVANPPVLAPTFEGQTQCVDGTTGVILKSNVFDATSWKWTNENNEVLGTETDLLLSQVNASFSGTYFVEVSTQVPGCFSVAQLELNITDALGEITATHLNSFACLDEVISLCAVPSIADATYEWRNPQGELFSTMECPVIPAATAGMGGTYTVQAILDGCFTNTASVDVALLTAPVATDEVVVGLVDVPQGFNVVVNDVLAAGAGYDITVVQEPANGTVTYDGDGVMIYTPNPGFRETDRLLYQICYEDCPDACDIALVTLHIVFPGDTCVITSLITPNEDGINDEFVVSCLEAPNGRPDNTLVIFNQWGDKVFDAGPYNNSWQGTYEGKDLPDGTYFYIFVPAPGEAVVKGFVMIYR